MIRIARTPGQPREHVCASEWGLAAVLAAAWAISFLILGYRMGAMF